VIAAAPARTHDAAIERVAASAYTLATDRPESDGTLSWDSTTLVLAEVEAEGVVGSGWTYGAPAIARLVTDLLAPALTGRAALDVEGATARMRELLRNVGEPGLGSMAVSAVDVALWDLKARLLDLPLALLLGRVHDDVPVYGSGGFCSYTDDELGAQLAGWVADGIPRVKMKVGREPVRDPGRIAVARRAVGESVDLFIDANGALTAKQALRLADEAAAFGVRWFEEPVSSRNLDGLRLVRERGPSGMDVAAGEYASTLADIRALLPVVDCLQVDVTRCGGITGLRAAAAVADAFECDVSGHTAPQIHAHVLPSVRRLRHLEWFHDHVRVEAALFDGVLMPESGSLRPDLSAPGLGVELRRADAERYRVA
jgi:L-alanine-DL-glutamate epimerase-like enolase superfamily enzyme